MSAEHRAGFIAVALGFFAAARFRSGHHQSGSLCAAACALVAIDALAFSFFVSVLAAGAMVAAGMAVLADTLPHAKRRGSGKHP